jgi:hypothetical protein
MPGRQVILLHNRESSTAGGGGTSGDGLNAQLRDQFTTAVNPLVDGATEPGTGSTGGSRDVTGALWKIIDGSLRGGMQPTSPTWGNSKITWDGQTRADGVALWALIQPTDRQADLGFGWASTIAVTDPTTNGHHWLVNDGYPRVSMPSKLVTLAASPDLGKSGVIRPTQYLVCIVMRAQGAFYLISSHAAHTRTGVANSNDYIGIPQYPQARVFWVDDATTTTPMYPHISALEVNGPTHLHYMDDLRVKVISPWASDAGLATFLDRITRADSTSSIGPTWTNLVGTFGVSSNKAYCQATTGQNVATTNSGLSGDGIWRVRITAPTTTTNQFGFAIRIVNSTNFIILHNGGGNNLLIHKCVAGSFTQLASTPVSWVAGQTYELTTITLAGRYQVYLDGSILFDWESINDTAHQTGTGFGPYTFNTTAAGARWDDFMAIPSTVTLPADIQIGARPSIFTVGSTIATDDFTAANGTALSGRTTTTGAKTWTTVGAGWEINTNKARNTNINSTEVNYFAYIDAGVADYEITADITSSAVNDWFYVGFVLRRSDANNLTYFRLRMGSDQPGNDEIEIWEVTGGVTLDTVKHQLGEFYTVSTTYAVKAQVVGRFMHIFVNGEPILGYVFSGGITGTGVGLYHNSADDGSTFDTFAVKALT